MGTGCSSYEGDRPHVGRPLLNTVARAIEQIVVEELVVVAHDTCNYHNEQKNLKRLSTKTPPTTVFSFL